MNPFKFKKPAISRNLALSLTAIILLFAFLICIFIYMEYSRVLFGELEDKADEHIRRLVSILATPLWSYDELNISTIGEQLSHNENIRSLRIIDNTEGIVYAFQKTAVPGNLIQRKGIIQYDGQAIGQVELSLTDHLYQKQLKQFLNTMLFVIAMILMLLLVATGFLLRIFLRSPLNMLDQAINRLAEGEDVSKDMRIDYREFSGIIHRFKGMAAQVKNREESLRSVNLELQAEIEERQKTEVKLEKSEAVLRATLESTKDGILVVQNIPREEVSSLLTCPACGTDKEPENEICTSHKTQVQDSFSPAPFRRKEQETISFVSHYNQRFKEIWAIPEEILHTRDDSACLEWAKNRVRDPVAFEKKAQEIYRTGKTAEDVIELTDGRYLERFSFPMKTETGISGRVWFFRDITERILARQKEKRLEARLRQSQKLEAIGTLAGGIAHDFNNMLAAIIGYAELAMENEPPEQRMNSHPARIMHAANRAKNLVRQILTFSRQTEIESRPVRMDTVISEAVNFLRSSLPATIRIETKISSHPVVMADPTQIYQVLMNLCTNAGHAMQENGGILEIGCRKVDMTEMNEKALSGLIPGQYVEISVKDTGHGIPEEIMDRIYEPFFTTKDKNRGTGMGLSVVHGIVKKHKGAMEVESEVGRGTTFVVYLPSAVFHETKVKRKEKANIPKGSERLLFVDDEPHLAELGKRLLEKIGYRVVAKTNSPDALEAFSQHPEDFDLVVTDMTMPDITGDRLADRLLRIRPDIPVIMCTGYTDIYTSARVRELGLKGVLMKPYVLETMARMVRDVLDGKI